MVILKLGLAHYPSLDLDKSRFKRLQNALALASLSERSRRVPTSAKSSSFRSQTIQLKNGSGNASNRWSVSSSNSRLFSDAYAVGLQRNWRQFGVYLFVHRSTGPT